MILKLNTYVKTSAKCAFRKKKKKHKFQLVNLFHFSAYHRTNAKEQLTFNIYLFSTYKLVPSTYIMLLDQNLNTNIRINRRKNDCNNIDKYGISHRNSHCVYTRMLQYILLPLVFVKYWQYCALLVICSSIRVDNCDLFVNYTFNYSS